MSDRHEVSPAFYSRKQSATMLVYKSVATIRRLEKAGKIRAVRHNGPHSPVKNPVADVEALVGGE